MSSNLKKTDFIIVQRGDKQYRISGDQILEFSYDQIEPDLNEIKQELEEEKVVRLLGDTKNSTEIENLILRLESFTNSLFPVHTNAQYYHRIDYTANADWAANYLMCAGEPLGPPPRVNDSPRCFDLSLDNYHDNVTKSHINREGAVFLPSYDLKVANIDAIFLNKYDINGTNSFEWEDRVAVGDLLMLNATKKLANGDEIVDNANYGVFRVIKNLGTRAPGSAMGDDQNLTGFQLQHIVSVEGFFIPNQLLQVRFMQNVEKTISDGFVSVHGDKMDGMLDIQLDDPTATDALTSNGTVHGNNLAATEKVILRETSGAIAFQDELFIEGSGSNYAKFDLDVEGLSIAYDKGARYVNAIDIEDNTQLPHKQYVDLADDELKTDIERLEDRLDALGNIAQTVGSVFKTSAYQGDANDDWIPNIIANNALEPGQFMVKAGNLDSTAFTSITRVLIHKIYDTDKMFNWASNLSLNDLFEISSSNPDEPYHYGVFLVKPPVEGDPYVIEHDLGGGNTAYEIFIEYLNSKGSGPIDDDTYNCNYYDRSSGLSLEAMDDRYVSLVGDEMSGDLQIKQADDAPVWFRCFSTKEDYFTILQDGNTTIAGTLTMGNTTTDPVNIMMPNAGWIEWAAPTPGTDVDIIKFNGNKILTISSSNNVIWGGVRMRNCIPPTTGTDDTETLLTRNSLNTFITTDPDSTVSLVHDADSGILTIAGGGATKSPELTDVKLTDPTDGDTLYWQASQGGFVNKPSAQAYAPGDNLFVEKEADAKKGGMWSTGGDSPAFYIRYK